MFIFAIILKCLKSVVDLIHPRIVVVECLPDNVGYGSVMYDRLNQTVDKDH